MALVLLFVEGKQQIVGLASMLNSYSSDDLELAQETTGLKALSIVRMVWSHKWLAVGFWLIASAISIVGVQLLPSVYVAEAVVLVDSQKIPENFVSSTVRGDIAGRLALISQNVMTSSRLWDIINTFNLYAGARKRLTQEELLRKMREDISVNFEKSWTGDRMQAFRLGYQGPNAATVAEVANRLASLYVAENVRTREDQAQGTVDFLRQQLQEAKKSLDEQEQKVAEFKREHNGTLPEQQSSLLATLNTLSMELQGVQTSIDRAQENQLSLRAALSAAESSEASLIAVLKRGSQIITESGTVLKSKSEVLTERLAALKAKYTPDHPDVQALEREIEEAKSTESVAPPTGSSPGQTPSLVSPELNQAREHVAILRAQTEVAKHQIESLGRQRQELAAEIAACQARIGKLPLTEQEMIALKRNYDESANNYNSLLQKKLAAGVATEMEHLQKAERFTVIDPAQIPERPKKPNRPLLAAIGSLAGLLGGLLLGFAIEYRKKAFLGEWELPSGTVVLGRVPLVQISAAKEI